MKKHLRGCVQLQALKLHLIHFLLHHRSRSLFNSLSLFISIALLTCLTLCLYCVWLFLYLFLHPPLCLFISLSFSLPLCLSLSFYRHRAFPIFLLMCSPFQPVVSLSHCLICRFQFFFIYLSLLWSVFLSHCLAIWYLPSFMFSLSVSLSLRLSFSQPHRLQGHVQLQALQMHLILLLPSHYHLPHSFIGLSFSSLLMSLFISRSLYYHADFLSLIY